MAEDNPRIDELRRRVREDPASIAFAQLGEELRRVGCYDEAVAVCRAGLQTYPAFHSARVTLARALTGVNLLDDAARELAIVFETAPQHPAAARAMAAIRRRRGISDDAPQIASGDVGSVAAGADILAGRVEIQGAERPPRADRTMAETEYIRLVRVLSALESWLTAINVARAQRHA